MENSIIDDEFLNDQISADNVEFAGFWIRLGAMIIDMLILAPIYLLGIFNSLNLKSLTLMLFLTSISAIYKPYLEWKKCATYGKLALGIKVVSESFTRLSLEQAIKRYIPWIISLLITTGLNVSIFSDSEFQNINGFTDIGLFMQEFPLSKVNTIYSYVFIVIVGSLIFNVRKQGFHDKFAETYCIKSKIA